MSATSLDIGQPNVENGPAVSNAAGVGESSASNRVSPDTVPFPVDGFEVLPPQQPLTLKNAYDLIFGPGVRASAPAPTPTATVRVMNAPTPLPGRARVISPSSRSVGSARTAPSSPTPIRLVEAPASEGRVKRVAMQIERDLGKGARRAFHEAGGDVEARSARRVHDDASTVYRHSEHVLTSWLRG